MVPGVLSEHRENCGYNRGVTKAMHTKKEAKDLELFRNGSVHEFYRLKALITLKQVISSVVEKKNNLNEQNFDGETNWSGDVNFHSITNESSDEHAVYFRRRLK